MNLILSILPIIISGLLSAAHFYRSGALILTGISLLVPFLLLSKNHKVPKIITLFLFLAACEWLWTMLVFIQRYQDAGISWTRLAIILSGVSLFTLLSSLTFKSRALKNRYQK